MVAVSSMHRHFLHTSQLRDPLDTVVTKPTSTLQYYNKAITALSERISSGDGSVSTTLMCCTLFICLETIHGDSQAFVGHVRNGQNLIIQWRAKHNMMYGKPQTTAAYNDDCLIEQYLVPFMANQDAFANCFLNEDLSADVLNDKKEGFSPRVKLPSAFDTFEQARAFLLKINELVITYARFNSKAKYTGLFAFSDVANLHSLQSTIRQWRHLFQDLKHRRHSTTTKDPHRAAITAMLDIHYFATHIWLATALTPEQCAFDGYMDSFQSIVDLAPTVIESRNVDAVSAGDSLQNTAWGTAVVPQLVFTAMLCRDPKIRREAVNLLRNCLDRFHGLWTKPVPSVIALTERWMEIEESAIPSQSQSQFQAHGQQYAYALDPSLDPLQHTGAGLTTDASPSEDGQAVEDVHRLPPEHARIHFSRLLDDNHERKSRITVRYQSKPWGVYNQWHFRDEEIVLP